MCFMAHINVITRRVMRIYQTVIKSVYCSLYYTFMLILCQIILFFKTSEDFVKYKA